MRFVSYLSSTGPRVAGVRADGYVDLHAADARLPTSLKVLLEQGPTALAQAAPHSTFLFCSSLFYQNSLWKSQLVPLFFHPFY